jgi:hypothetical protein
VLVVVPAVAAAGGVDEPSRAAIAAAATTMAIDSEAPTAMIRRRRSTQAAGWHIAGNGRIGVAGRRYPKVTALPSTIGWTSPAGGTRHGCPAQARGTCSAFGAVIERPNLNPV